MTRLQLLEKVKDRRQHVGITVESLSKLSNVGYKTIMRFFAGDDVKLSTVEKITNVLGLDFAGNEVIDINALRDKRAKERALYIVSLVQDTSSLEMQGLDNEDINEMLQDTKMQLLYGEYKDKLWAS
ncbi:MAG: helix-turn-helix domain-containing protein [Thiovulaceae bacterium]|nr:helix-turn-helix domain-containing protein [Sulfurimonadaceae bacterium]